MRSRGFFFNTSSWYDLFSLVVVVAWFEVRRLYEEQLIAINLLPIYLDELGNPEEQPVAISLLSLTIVPEAQMVTQVKQLIERVRAQEPSPLPKDDIIDVITTIAVDN